MGENEAKAAIDAVHESGHFKLKHVTCVKALSDNRCLVEFDKTEMAEHSANHVFEGVALDAFLRNGLIPVSVAVRENYATAWFQNQSDADIGVVEPRGQEGYRGIEIE